MTLTRLNITALTLIAFLLASLRPEATAKEIGSRTDSPAPCTALLAGAPHPSSPDNDPTPTQLLTAYLTDLLNQKTIGREELERFIEGLQVGRIINPFSEEKATLDTASVIHSQGIQERLDSGNDLDQGELLAWARDALSRLQQIQIERTDASIETQSPYRKIIFHPVPAGSFLRRISRNNPKTTATLTHPFEAMATQVTQLHWAKVMGDNPSHFVNGPQSIEIEINGKKIRLNPDHPVEMITWWSALVFANRLSELNGLKPVYYLSVIEFKAGSAAWPRSALADDDILRVAAKGALGPINILSQPQINGPEGNIYKTEGYRLPTYAEQVYLMSNAGRSNGEYYFGDDSKQLKYHAWYKENSEGKTHPVGLLRPMSIGTGVFYDVLGNVDEWAYDVAHEMSGANPIGRIATEAAISGGGPYSLKNLQLNRLAYTSSREKVNPNVGLRLVRTLKPGSPIIERVRTQ